MLPPAPPSTDTDSPTQARTRSRGRPARSRARSHLRCALHGPVPQGPRPGQQHERGEEAQRAQHGSEQAGPVVGPRRR